MAAAEAGAVVQRGSFADKARPTLRPEAATPNCEVVVATAAQASQSRRPIDTAPSAWGGSPSGMLAGSLGQEGPDRCKTRWAQRLWSLQISLWMADMRAGLSGKRQKAGRPRLGRAHVRPPGQRRLSHATLGGPLRTKKLPESRLEPCQGTAPKALDNHTGP